jgi:hypothetical protein
MGFDAQEGVKISWFQITSLSFFCFVAIYIEVLEMKT